MTFAALALAGALAAGPPAPRVLVELLARDAPRGLALAGPGGRVALAARGDRLVADGREVAQPYRLPYGAWRVAAPGAPARRYRAALEVSARAGVLRVRGALDLEEYVAAVVASETLPGAPAEALAAQAVVVRSYALAARDRHEGGALCDLAHCQVLRGHGVPARHLAAARAAARATAGEVLRLPSGAIAEAPFHAACGGHTADPREVFGGASTGAAAVPDPGCPVETWRASVDPSVLARAVRGAASRAGVVPPVRLRARDLELSTGKGGWVVEVATRDGRLRMGGDAFARALDGALGWGEVRSGRLSLADAGGSVLVRGGGAGHGVGLCQAGAFRRAAEGEDHRAILRHYFPAAREGRPPPPSLDAPP